MDGARYEAAWRVAQSLRHWVHPCGESPPIDLPEAVWAEMRGTIAPPLGGAIERARLNQMTGEAWLAAAGLFPSIFNCLCDLAKAVRGDPTCPRSPVSVSRRYCLCGKELHDPAHGPATH